jgi:hypothetical protein
MPEAPAATRRSHSGQGTTPLLFYLSRSATLPIAPAMADECVAQTSAVEVCGSSCERPQVSTTGVCPRNRKQESNEKTRISMVVAALGFGSGSLRKNRPDASGRYVYSSRVACRISVSACLSRESSWGFQRLSIPILWGLQRGQERRFRLSRLRMDCAHKPRSSFTRDNRMVFPSRTCLRAWRTFFASSPGRSWSCSRLEIRVPPRWKGAFR